MNNNPMAQDAALEAELNNLQENPKPKVKKGAAADPWKLSAPKNLGDLTKAEAQEVEDELHSMERMASVRVMEEEIKVMEQLAKGPGECRDVYEDKKELLEYRKELTMKNIENGFIGLDKYAGDMKKELAYEKNLLESLKLSKCKEEDVKRVEKRIELVGKELAECEGIQTEPEPEPKPAEQHKEEKKESESKEEVRKEVNNQAEAKVTKQENSEEKGPSDTKNAKEEAKKQMQPKQLVSRGVTRQGTTDPNFFLDEEISEKDIDFTKVDKEQYKTVMQRKDEYREATAYLMENGFAEQSQLLLKKLERLNKCLKVIVKEKKKIDLLKVEPPLTPEIMFNCSKEKRDALYNEVIKQLQQQALPLRSKLEKFKRLPKKDRAHLAKQMLPTAKKLKEAEVTINLLKVSSKNPWTPVPVCHVEPTFQEVDITNKEIRHNILSLEYNPDPKIINKKYYVLFYKLKNDKDAVRGRTPGYDPKKIDIQFPRGTRNISECTLSLKLKGRKYLLFKPFRAKLKLRLEELEHENEIKHQVPEFRNKYVINVTIRVRLPADGKTTKTVEGKELMVNKVYRPFRGQTGAALTQAPAKQLAPQKSQAKVPAASSSKPPSKPEAHVQAKPVTKGDPPLPKQLELPASVTVQDVVDPDNVANLVCVSYLEKRITYYNSLIQQTSKQGKKVPDALSKLVNQMVKNKATIEGQIERGVLTPEKYKGFLEMQLEKDKKLLECLAKYKQERKVPIVKERIQCLQNEINSL